MSEPYCTTRRVEFRDTDAAGIAHFSAFLFYMESVEHELLRHLGLSVVWADELGPVSWPRVAVSCDYSGAARFEEVLDVTLRVARARREERHLRIRIHLRRSRDCQGTHRGRLLPNAARRSARERSDSRSDRGEAAGVCERSRPTRGL